MTSIPGSGADTCPRAPADQRGSDSGRFTFGRARRSLSKSHKGQNATNKNRMKPMITITPPPPPTPAWFKRVQDQATQLPFAELASGRR